MEETEEEGMKAVEVKAEEKRMKAVEARAKEEAMGEISRKTYKDFRIHEKERETAHEVRGTSACTDRSEAEKIEPYDEKWLKPYKERRFGHPTKKILTSFLTKIFSELAVYIRDEIYYNYITNVNKAVICMTKMDQMEEMLKVNNGYLFVSEVEKADISRTYMARFVRERNLEMVSKGIYITEDTWEDHLFIIQVNNPKAIFSGETALYLNHLLEREYSEICVSIPQGHNGARLRERGIRVHAEREGIYGCGICELETNYGNRVKAYNGERCICDLIKSRSKYEVQTYQEVLKNYMKDKQRDLSRLVIYAERLRIKDEVMKYVEVMA